MMNGSPNSGAAGKRLLVLNATLMGAEAMEAMDMVDVGAAVEAIEAVTVAAEPGIMVAAEVAKTRMPMAITKGT